MAYTKTNMRRTLETAKQYLKAGFVKGEWVCKLDEVGSERARGRTCKYFCCAEGSIALAAGQKECLGTDELNPYAKHIVDLVEKQVTKDPDRIASSLVGVNDANGTRYRDVEKYFNRAIKELS